MAGKVQGVFFRASAADLARTLNLSGHVMNKPDGSVYIEVEGEEPALQQFVSWCRNGPPAARVDNCEVREGTLKGHTGFGIQRW